MKQTIANLKLLPKNPDEIPFSFTQALASSLQAMGSPLDRKMIAGASGFAFRIWVEKSLCPSAMSIFDFKLLKAGVELCGYTCTHITRLWQDGTKPSGCWLDATPEAQQWQAAHPIATDQEIAGQAIREAVDRGTAPIVWDIGIPEWGLIAGYDDEAGVYETIDCRGLPGMMPYAQLGRREIPILAVTIPGQPTGQGLQELAAQTIQMAVNHARGLEWEERPAYENGLAAYPKWAACIHEVDQTAFSAHYYATTYAALRRQAAEYLEELAKTDPALLPAARAYQRVAASLKGALAARQDPAFPSAGLLDGIQAAILRAGVAEQEGVEHLEKWLQTRPY